MVTHDREKSAEHLINLILTRNGNIPNFSVLLGSGASSTSGIKTAQDMVKEWRGFLYKCEKPKVETQTEWLKSQYWFDHEDEYSILFEAVYDQPLQRRVYVEECVKDGHPSWGYVYLTKFLKNKLFDVVFTTNFDDLINEACYLYSDGLRPIVAAHDSAIQGIRVTAERPKIIKLHGDFLYDNIKNTLTELETLEANTKRKLSQFAKEYGLVVLGYSGRDRSVMDTLDLLLRDEENYQQGVYWCKRREGQMSDRLKALLRRDRVHVVEIDGFDEFMADLHESSALGLPKPIAKPFDIARDRARLFVEVKQEIRSHPVIDGHIEEILNSIQDPMPSLPPVVEATLLSEIGAYEDAIPKWKLAFEEYPDNETNASRYADALFRAGRMAELEELLPSLPLPMHRKAYLSLKAGMNQKVVDFATEFLDGEAYFGIGSDDDSAYVRINRAIALKRLGRTEEMLEDLRVLEEFEDRTHPNIKVGVAALRGNKETLLTELAKVLNKTISPKDLKDFPVFEDYQDDPDFQNLTSELSGPAS